MATTEGVGGPCPSCEEENCYIRTGTAGWFQFIACPDCLFAYGENDDSRGVGSFKQVSGADVWSTILKKERFDTVESMFDSLRNADYHDMDNPFNFSDLDESDLMTWRVDKKTLYELYEGVPEIWEREGVKVVESVDHEVWGRTEQTEQHTDGDVTMTDKHDTVEVNRVELATVIDEAEENLDLHDGEYGDELETAIISLREKLDS